MTLINRYDDKKILSSSKQVFIITIIIIYSLSKSGVVKQNIKQYRNMVILKNLLKN